MRGIRRLLLIPAIGALAQNPTGRITGRVTDPSGAAIPSVAVRAIDIETNVETAAVTTGEGVYEILNLIPGHYRLIAALKGFKSYERRPIELRVGDTLTVDIGLEVGDVTQSVTVGAEAPLLEAATAGVAQVIDRRRIQDLPLPNGNVTYLMLLAPGVNGFRGSTHNWSTSGSIDNSLVTSPGTRSFATEYTIDGAPVSPDYQLARNVLQLLTVVPPPEMLQEVRIQSAPFDASVGHSSGSNVDMAIRTGTNQLHGIAFFSHNSRPLITRGFFINATPGREWPYSRRNKYRGTLSGPVYFPRLFHGRDRTFFSYGFEVADELRSRSSPQTVPDQAERRGDLSGLLALGPQYQIYDPATTAPASGLFRRQPFHANMIPANRLNPVAQNLLRFYPLPNTAGRGGQNNYAGPANELLRSTMHLIRADHVLNSRHRLYGTFIRDISTSGNHGAFGNNATGDSGDGSGITFALNHIATLQPNLILNLRYGLRRGFGWTHPNSTGIDLKSLGFPSSLIDRLDPKLISLPAITIDGYAGLGSGASCAACPGIVAGTNHFASASMTHVRGAHTLRTGGEFRVEQRNNFPYINVAPVFNFTGAWTNGPLNTSPAVPLAHGLAEFLLGIPSTGYLDRNAHTSHQFRFLGGFVQDDWKLSRRLTVNLGLRYELETPVTERFNRVNRGFDFTTANPVEAAARARYAESPIPQIPVEEFRVRGGLLFAGVNGEPRRVYDLDTNNFMPRVGLAWMARPKTVVRAGYGIYFGLLGGVATIQQGFSQRTNMIPSADNGLSFRATLSNPFPDGILEAPGASGGLKTYLGQSPEFYLGAATLEPRLRRAE